LKYITVALTLRAERQKKSKTGTDDVASEHSAWLM
jgi:hypothetical protein